MTTREQTRAIANALRELSLFFDYPLADNRQWINYHLNDFEAIAIAENEKRYDREILTSQTAQLICLLACFLEYPDTATWSRMGDFLYEYQRSYFLGEASHEC